MVDHCFEARDMFYHQNLSHLEFDTFGKSTGAAQFKYFISIHVSRALIWKLQSARSVESRAVLASKRHRAAYIRLSRAPPPRLCPYVIYSLGLQLEHMTYRPDTLGVCVVCDS